MAVYNLQHIEWKFHAPISVESIAYSFHPKVPYFLANLEEHFEYSRKESPLASGSPSLKYLLPTLIVVRM